MSPTVQPVAVAISMTTCSLESETITCLTRGSAARQAASTFRRRSSFLVSSVTTGGSLSA